MFKVRGFCKGNLWKGWQGAREDGGMGMKIEFHGNGRLSNGSSGLIINRSKCQVNRWRRNQREYPKSGHIIRENRMTKY